MTNTDWSPVHRLVDMFGQQLFLDLLFWLAISKHSQSLTSAALTQCWRNFFTPCIPVIKVSRCIWKLSTVTYKSLQPFTYIWRHYLWFTNQNITHDSNHVKRITNRVTVLPFSGVSFWLFFVLLHGNKFEVSEQIFSWLNVIGNLKLLTHVGRIIFLLSRQWV